MTRSRLTRCALLVLGGLAALVFAGCSGITSPASDVTDNSATLRATVGWSNGETISWWFEIRQPGATWSVVKFHGPLVVRNTARDVALSEPVNALTPGTTYEYRLCSYFITSGGKQVGGPENPICVDQENGAPSDHWSQFTTTGIAPDPPPQTTVTSNPSGTITVDTATFSFVSSEENSTFECQLARGTLGTVSESALNIRR